MSSLVRRRLLWLVMVVAGMVLLAIGAAEVRASISCEAYRTCSGMMYPQTEAEYNAMIQDAHTQRGLGRGLALAGVVVIVTGGARVITTLRDQTKKAKKAKA